MEKEINEATIALMGFISVEAEAALMKDIFEIKIEGDPKKVVKEINRISENRLEITYVSGDKEVLSLGDKEE